MGPLHRILSKSDEELIVRPNWALIDLGNPDRGYGILALFCAAASLQRGIVWQ
jgi:hypothetical protein